MYRYLLVVDYHQYTWDGKNICRRVKQSAVHTLEVDFSTLNEHNKHIVQRHIIVFGLMWSGITITWKHSCKVALCLIYLTFIWPRVEIKMYFSEGYKRVFHYSYDNEVSYDNLTWNFLLSVQSRLVWLIMWKIINNFLQAYLLSNKSQVKRSSSLTNTKCSGRRAFYATLGKREIYKNNTVMSLMIFQGLKNHFIKRKKKIYDRIQDWLSDQKMRNITAWRFLSSPARTAGSEG